jgi:hypothetical protein
MVRKSPYRQAIRPLSTRKALLVWLGCALTGWLVAIFSIYGALQFSDRLVAVLTEPDEVRVTNGNGNGESMQDIAPAAGDDD